MDAVKNFAKATLDVGIDDTETTIELASGDGGRFPATPFNAVIWNATDYSDPADDPAREIVRVTARSTDTLTVTRGQEGTSGITHNTAGKVYGLLAGLTAKVINDDIPDISRSGDDWNVTSDGNFTVIASTAAITLISTLAQIQAVGALVAMGDLDGTNTGVAVRIDDTTGRIGFTGQLATDQTASASGPVGTVVAKLPIRSLDGTLVGYLPIYDAIT